jgi:uncharacterized membrane protein YphA (DoxX/SURF4 family)
MKEKKHVKYFMMANSILLGLLMLVAGLTKLLVMGPDAVSGMMSGIALFSWAPMFWAWVLIILEIGAGIAILSKWKLFYATKVAAIILLVATLTVTIKWTGGGTSWNSVILHLIAITNYLMLGCKSKN